MKLGILGEHVVTGVIAVNSACLMWELVGHSELADQVEACCLAFFVVELLVRMRLRQFNRWTLFDALVIGLCLIPLTGADTSLLRLARLSPRVIHLMRHATHLRWVRYLVAEGRVIASQ